jgi:glucose/arabinose dehydrogenase
VIDLSGRKSRFAGARRWAAGLLAVGAILVLGTAARAGAETLPPGFQDQVVLSGLDDPTSIAFNQDGSKVFVGLKGGVIKEFDGFGDPTPTVVADLRTEVYNHFDRGLLGLALDPQYPARPYLYALYSLDAPPGESPPYWGQPGDPNDLNDSGDPCVDPGGGDCTVTGRLARLTLGTNDVATAKQNLITDWCDQSSTHSVGDLAFGPDGALYASGGDGARYGFTDWGQNGNPLNPCGDPPGGVGADLEPPTAEGGALRSQDIQTSGDPAGLDGTIIRVNPDTGAGMPDNPFAASADPNKRRIVAYGLRNPFRFTVRPGVAGEIWAGDVGWNDFEEINRVADPTDSTADNFGWPCYEGFDYQPSYALAGLNICEGLYSQGTALDPYFDYAHADHIVPGEGCFVGSSSVTGVAFNQPGTYPSTYDGALFFEDFSRSCIWAMLAGPNGEPNPDDVVTLVDGAIGPIDLKLGPDGHLYYVDLYDGAIRRITYTAGNQAPHAVATATPSNTHDSSLTTQLDASGSTDPDPGETQTLTYHWDLDEDGNFNDATGATASKTYSTVGVYHPAVKVTDSHGNSSIATVEVQVGNTPPSVQITAPGSGLQWATGDPVAFSGTATDLEQSLPNSRYRWKILLNHCPSTCHQHGVELLSGATSGSFTAPDHEYPSSLTIKLTVTDDGGLVGTDAVTIEPRTVQLTLQTTPSGLPLGLDGGVDPAPVTATVIANSTHTVTAPGAANLQGADYAFGSWSDGGAPSHTLTVSADRTLVARYDALAPAAVPTSPPAPSSSSQGATAKKKKCKKLAKKRAAASKAKCKKKRR